MIMMEVFHDDETGHWCPVPKNLFDLPEMRKSLTDETTAAFGALIKSGHVAEARLYVVREGARETPGK